MPAPSFRLARAEWAERAVLSGGTAGGVHWLPSTRPSAVSGLFAMDHGVVPSTPRVSFRTFLEHLSGAGKAIGVLTSGGDAQGALPPPRAGAEGDIGERGWRYQGEHVETPGKRLGYGEKGDVGEQPSAREPLGTCSLQVTAGARREGYGSPSLHPEDQLIFHLHVILKIETGDGVVWTALVVHLNPTRRMGPEAP